LVKETYVRVRLGLQIPGTRESLALMTSADDQAGAPIVI